MGVGRIPWPAMRDYAEHIRYPFPEDFYTVLMAMDKEFIEWHSEQDKLNANAKAEFQRKQNAAKMGRT